MMLLKLSGILEKDTPKEKSSSPWNRANDVLNQGLRVIVPTYQSRQQSHSLGEFPMTTVEALASNKITRSTSKTSLARAALIAGIGLLIMVIAAPFAEIYVLPKLVSPDHAAETVNNIIANQSLYTYAIFAYLITFICDLVVAWALYILLKPVNKNLSLITAGFRWVYTGIALVALLNLVTILRLLNTSDTLSILQPDQLGVQV